MKLLDLVHLLTLLFHRGRLDTCSLNSFFLNLLLKFIDFDVVLFLLFFHLVDLFLHEIRYLSLFVRDDGFETLNVTFLVLNIFDQIVALPLRSLQESL